MRMRPHAASSGLPDGGPSYGSEDVWWEARSPGTIRRRRWKEDKGQELMDRCSSPC